SALPSILSPSLVFVIVAIVLNEGLQSIDCHIPFCRDLIEGTSSLLETLRLELPDHLPSPTMIAHQPSPPECTQLLGDRLSGDPGAFAQLGDRKRPVCAQPRYKPGTSRVSQRGEHRRGLAQLERRRAMASRHTSRWP